MWSDDINKERLVLKKALEEEQEISLALGLEYDWVEEILQRELGPLRCPVMSQADCIELILEARRTRILELIGVD